MMRRAPAAPLVVNEPISCSNPIGVSNLLLWTPLVGVSLQGPRQIKRQPVRRNESSCPVTNMGYTEVTVAWSMSNRWSGGLLNVA